MDIELIFIVVGLMVMWWISNPIPESAGAKITVIIMALASACVVAYSIYLLVLKY